MNSIKEKLQQVSETERRNQAAMQYYVWTGVLITLCIGLIIAAIAA